MKKILFCLLVCLCVFSCTKEDRKFLVVQQESAIDSYIKTLTNSEVVYCNGVVRAVLDRGTTKDTAAVGDSVYFYYAGYIFSNGKGQLFHTNSDSVAQANNWPMEAQGATLRTASLGSGELLKGLDYGMEGMGLNEHSYIIFNADYGYGNQRVGQVPALSALLFEVWLKQIRKN